MLAGLLCRSGGTADQYQEPLWKKRRAHAFFAFATDPATDSKVRFSSASVRLLTVQVIYHDGECEGPAQRSGVLKLILRPDVPFWVDHSLSFPT